MSCKPSAVLPGLTPMGVGVNSDTNSMTESAVSSRSGGACTPPGSCGDEASKMPKAPLIWTDPYLSPANLWPEAIGRELGPANLLGVTCTPMVFVARMPVDHWPLGVGTLSHAKSDTSHALYSGCGE